MNYKTIIAVSTCLLVASCARQNPTIPLVENHPASYQKKLQAAQHWNLLAEDVSRRLTTEMLDSHPGTPPAVYVRQTDVSPFGRAFHGFLLTHLNDRGFNVREDSVGALILDYETQVVRHEGRGTQYAPGMWTALGAGAWVIRGLVDGGVDTALQVGGTLIGTAAMDAYEHDKMRQHLYPQPDTEIIVNVSMKEGKQILARTSDIYYINDPDNANYSPILPMNKQHYAGPQYMGEKNVRVSKCK